MSKLASRSIRVVAGLIVRTGLLLVCQRRHDAAFPLKWEFPGGKIEAGESAEQALVRELKEELAIDVLESEQLCEHVHAYDNGPRVELHFFQVREFSGEIVNHVFEQLAWSSLGQLSQFDFLDGDLPLIKRLVAGEIRLRGIIEHI